MHEFVAWYNQAHKHSGLKFQTPQDRHEGLAEDKAANRTLVYQQAKYKHPERWGNRATRSWVLPEEVWLNPENSDRVQPLVAAA